MLSRISAICLLAAATAVALAAQPTVTSVSPARNAANVSHTANVSANFSTNMATPSSSTFRVWSNLRGWLGGSYSGGGSSSLTLNPAGDLLPGEELQVVLTKSLQDNGGTALTGGNQWKFRASATAGPKTWNKRDVQTSQYTPFDAAFGDLDGDGDIDMVTVGGGNVGYDKKYINDGKGNFTASDIARVADGSYCCALADMDNDGDLDIIVGNHEVKTGGNTISAANRIYWNDGNANFYTNTTFGATTGETIKLDVGDVDNDGDIDIITANGAINGQANYVWFNDGSGNLTGQAIMYVSGYNAPISDTAWAVRLGDVDGDGDLDAIYGISSFVSSASNPIYLNDGAGNFTAQNSTTYETNSVVQALATGDFDGDGDLDFIGGGNGTCASNVYFNDGSGNFSAQQWDSGTMPIDSLKTADVDGDGDLDVLVGSNSSHHAFIMFNNGSGAFSSSASSNVEIGTTTVEAWGFSVADIDNDGDLDIATPSYIVYNGSNPPAFTVTANGNALISGDTVQVANGDSVQSAGLSFQISDADGDPVSVSTSISNNTSQGFAMNEWSTGSTSSPVTLAPTTGTFNVSNVSHTVTLTASDGVETTTFVLHIDVGSVANAAPVISVNSYNGGITAGSTVNVSYNSKMSALGMAVSVTDADNDNVSLTTQMTNISGMGISTSGWSHSAQTAPYTLYPWDGTFNQQGALIYVIIQADDGVGGTVSFSFYFQTSTTGNYVPTINVTSNGTPVMPFETINVNYNDTMASLGLQITVDDQNGDNVTMSSSVSNLYSTGIQSTEFGQNGATPLTLTPSSGAFNQGNIVHTVSMVVGDTHGTVCGMKFYISVGTAPANNPPAISISSTNGGITNGATVNVNHNDTLASLGLAIQVTDPDNDSVILTGSVSYSAGTGIQNSEFSNTATAPYTLNPTSGTFSQAGTTHTVTLSANDAKGGTATFSFDIVVGAAANNPPAISVSGNAGSISNGATLNVNYGSTLAALGLAIHVTDADNDSVSLSGTVSNTGGTNITNGEFGNTAAAPYTVNPGTGTFNQANTTHHVSLSADDSYGGTASFSFDIVVGAVPNNAPTISVNQSGISVSNGGSIGALFNDTLASLSIVISVADADNDTVTLTGTVSNTSGTNITNSEFSNNAAAPYSVSPATGTFNQAGVTHHVSLSADDGNGGTVSFSFDIVVGPNLPPGVSVTSNGSAVSDGSTINVSHGTDLIALGLVITVTDPDSSTVAMAGTITSASGTGMYDAEFSGVGASPLSVAPVAGTFNQGSTVHTITLDASDGNGLSATFTFYVSVGIAPTPSIEVYENSTSGTPIPAGSAASGGRDFGSQDVSSGATTSLTVVIHNAGTAALDIISVFMAGGDAGEFVLGTNGLGSSVSAGNDASFTVAFNPTSTGSKVATVRIAHNDTSTQSPYTFEVSGVGTTPAPAPIIVVSDNSGTIGNGGLRNFGSFTQGTPSAPLSITVTNAGNAPLNVGTIGVTGPNASEFAISGNVGTLAAGASGLFTVTYMANAVGNHSATISFTHNDTSTVTPFTISVSGATSAVQSGGGSSGGSGSGGGGGCVAGSSFSLVGLLFLLLIAGLAVVRNRRLES